MYKSKFDKLSEERHSYLNRARASAELTIPTLIKTNDQVGANQEYLTPYQSVGARGVANLSSKLLLSLLPTNTPFFRLLVPDNALEQFPPEQQTQIKSEINESLQKIEKSVLEEIEDSNLRSIIFEVLKNLIVTGNSLLYVGPDGKFKNYSLEDYVICRDIEGNVLRIIIREQVAPEVLDQYTLEDNAKLPSDEGLGSDQTKNIELYTHIQLKDDLYEVTQEISGKKVIQDELIFSKMDLPWLALRLTSITGESYGRGYVETILGDLKSLEALTKAMVEAAAIMSKVVFMVNPASTTRAKVLAEAPNGAVVNGNAGDVTVLQVGKSGDLSMTFNAAQRLEQRLGLAFMLFENAVRDSERTTATEIRALINSLEQILAGVYSVLTQELLRPLVHLIVKRMTDEQKIPELPESIKVIISTGLTALGRVSDVQRLTEFTQLVGATVGPEAIATFINPSEMVVRIATAVGVDSEGLVKTQEDLQKEQQAAIEAQQMQAQQQQMMNLVEKAAPGAVKAIGEQALQEQKTNGE